MTDNQRFFRKDKVSHLFNIYLTLFVALGFMATAYIGITNHKVHEVFFNKPLLAGLFVTISTAMLFFLKAETRLNIALSHFFIIFSLFLSNALFEVPFFSNFNSVRSVAKRAGVKWDIRSKYQVIEDYRKNGIKAYPAANSSALVARKEFFTEKFNLNFEDRIFPLSGISNVKTVFCNEAGPWVSYISDRYGFNNDDNVYEDTRNSVIFVGDSFARGECVEPGDDIAGNLRRRGYKAISLGIGGNAPLMELATLKEYGPHLTPKIIIWMYFEGNDFVNIPDEYNFPPLKKYLDGEGYTQNLVQKQNVLDKFWINFFDLTKEAFAQEKNRAFWHQEGKTEEIRGLIRRLVSLYNIRSRLGLSRRSYILDHKIEKISFDEHEMMFRDVMKAAITEAEKLNSKLYFVYLPTFESLFVEKYSIAPSSQRVRKVIFELGIPLIDFYEHLKNSEDPAKYFPFRRGGHYNPEGYNLLADLIEAEALKSR